MSAFSVTWVTANNCEINRGVPSILALSVPIWAKTLVILRIFGTLRAFLETRDFVRSTNRVLESVEATENTRIIGSIPKWKQLSFCPNPLTQFGLPLRPKAQLNAEKQDVYQSGSVELREV